MCFYEFRCKDTTHNAHLQENRTKVDFQVRFSCIYRVEKWLVVVAAFYNNIKTHPATK